MKLAVSMALAVMLLAMPLACVLAVCQDTPDPCCPRTSTNIHCPYDIFDSAKVTTLATAAEVPSAITIAVPRPATTLLEPAPALASNTTLYLLNRVLRI